MPATPIQAVPAEPVPEKDGLIYGVSAAELQSLCETCMDAREKAYCESVSLPFLGWKRKGGGNNEGWKEKKFKKK